MNEPAPIAGAWFDGRTAVAQAVAVWFTPDGGLRLRRAGEVERAYAAAGVRVAARLGNTPRRVELPGGELLELADNAAVDAALAHLGRGRGAAWRHRMESSWRWAAVGVVVLATGGWLFVKQGLPWAAERVARALPIEVNEQIGREALATLDGWVFTPSELTAARQEELRQRFRAFLRAADDGYPYQLEFRTSRIGPNAFALPSGTIVLTDELIELAKADEELVAVLAHECGHIQGRHALRSLLQNSALVLAFTALTGDVSGISSAGAAWPGWLLEKKFSRSFEGEADAHAVATLRRAGLEPALLAALLERLEALVRGAPAGDGRAGKVLNYLSTHPSTPERVRRLREGRAP